MQFKEGKHLLILSQCKPKSNIKKEDFYHENQKIQQKTGVKEKHHIQSEQHSHE